MKNILVTGGSGFIASHVCDELTSHGFNVTIFDKKKSKFKKKNQKMFIGDLASQKQLNKAFKNINTVYHFAATADLYEANSDLSNTVQNNILGTLKVLEACKKNNVKHIIFASSIYALSEQGGIYSTSKLSAEMIIERYHEKYDINFTILRFGTVYGDRANEFNTIYGYLKQAKLNNVILRNTDGKEKRSYIHVRDVAKICSKLVGVKYQNKYFNLVGEKKIFVKNLIKIISELVPKLKIIFIKRKRLYNYKVNPFTYKLRKGKNIKLKRYINLKKSLKKLLEKIN